MSEVADIQEPFRKWLSEQGLLHVWQRTDKPTSTEKGLPDFIVMSGNLFLAIECKGDKTPVSAEQKAWHAKLAATGGKVHIARSFPECVELVRNWISGMGRGAAVPRSTETQQLHRFGNNVVRRNGNSFDVVRPCREPGDQLLPTI